MREVKAERRGVEIDSATHGDIQPERSLRFKLLFKDRIKITALEHDLKLSGLTERGNELEKDCPMMNELLENPTP